MLQMMLSQPLRAYQSHNNLTPMNVGCLGNYSLSLKIKLLSLYRSDNKTISSFHTTAAIIKFFVILVLIFFIVLHKIDILVLLMRMRMWSDCVGGAVLQASFCCCAPHTQLTSVLLA